MTSYRVLHRTAQAQRGDRARARRRAGSASRRFELAGMTDWIFGTASARDRDGSSKLGAVAIDYKNEDFLARVRRRPAGWTSWSTASVDRSRCARSARCDRADRLVVFGRYDTLKDGHKDWPAVIKW